jgi:hypothetical protein
MVEPGDTARKVILKEVGYEQVYNIDEVITPDGRRSLAQALYAPDSESVLR